MKEKNNENQQQKLLLYSISANINEKKPNSPSKFGKICHQLREHSGIFYGLSASLIFSCSTFSLKLVPADVFDLMIVRFLVQTICFGIFAAFYKRYTIFTTKGHPLACASNALISSLTNLTYMAALGFLPLSDLNTIKYTYIVWAAIFAVFFLKDRFRPINGITLLFAFIGLILTTKPDIFFTLLSHIMDKPAVLTVSNVTNSTKIISTIDTTSSYYYLGIGLASISAIGKAMQITARSQLVKCKQPYSVMNLHFTACGLCVSTLYTIIRRFWQPGPYPWKWMGTVGVAIGFVQLLSNTLALKALKRENVQLITILGSLDIVYAVILQYIFFNQTKPWIFYVGALFIVSSAAILSIDRYRTLKNARKIREQVDVVDNQ